MLRKLVIISTVLIFASSFSLIKIPSNVEAAGFNVGYYEMATGQGEAYMTGPITANGDTPVLVTVPDAATLAGLDILFVSNSFGWSPAEWSANLTAIDNAVANGLVLVFSDWDPSGSSTSLPGASGISFTFSPVDNIDIVNTGTPVTAGLTNTSLDNGNNSTHGYADAATLPAGAVNILSNGVATHSVTFSYPYGMGSVIYSTVPLTWYLYGAGVNPPRDAMNNIYTPNLIAYADVLAVPSSVTGIDYTQLGMIKISVSQAQPVYDAPAGSVIRNADTSEMWLPHDYDSNGYDTYVVTEVVDVDGVPWVAIFLGSESFGYVPLSGVTPIEGNVAP